jgi:hypothetical protein
MGAGELVQTTRGEWITHPPTRCPVYIAPAACLPGSRACHEGVRPWILSDASYEPGCGCGGRFPLQLRACPASRAVLLRNESGCACSVPLPAGAIAADEWRPDGYRVFEGEEHRRANQGVERVCGRSHHHQRQGGYFDNARPRHRGEGTSSHRDRINVHAVKRDALPACPAGDVELRSRRERLPQQRV